MSDDTTFKPAFFTFLRELKDNNDRDWFAANKSRYIDDVKEPLQRFIGGISGRLGAVSTELICDPKKSMFRIYRDVRFGKNKAPYKTHAAAQFRHVAGKDAHTPGLYLHLEPDSVFLGAGIWQPDKKSIAGIRDRIVAKPAEWKRVMADPKLAAAGWKLVGSSLKRGPKGYDLEHPLMEDIKRKDFIASVPSSEADACTPGFGDRFVDLAETVGPLMRFLTKAVGVSY